jgi:hypothetical protein
MYDITFDFQYVNQLDSRRRQGGRDAAGAQPAPRPEMKYWYATNPTSGKPVFEPVDFAKLFTIYTDTIT